MYPLRYVTRSAVVAAVVFGWAAVASAQSVGLPAPRLLTVVPMGGQAGTEVEVTIGGEYLEDVGDLVFSDKRITAKRKLDSSGKPVENRFTVAIAADCRADLYEARVQTRLGVSSARAFAVGMLKEVHCTLPNKSISTAMELPLNSVCNGAVSDRAIDFFKFAAKKGQRLILDCATRGIDSKLNATIILGDAAGRDILVERRGGALDFTVPADGTYTIKLHELTFKGGPAFYYRLGLWEQPAGSPMVRQPGTKAVNTFSWPPPGLPAKAATAESESAAVQKVTLPCDIAGRFFPAADVDMYEFTAKKGEEWWIEVASDRLGLPTDPAVLVQRVVEGQLVDVMELSDIPSPVKVSSNGYAYDGPPYNAGSSDVLGKLTVPEDGVYRVQLNDLFGGTRSEPAHAYRLVIRKAEPDFALVAWALHMELRNGDRNALSKPLTLRSGGTMALEVVAVRRDGFTGDIELAMDGLPPGVTATGLKIPAGQSRGLMLLTAKPDAPRGYANASFTGRASISGKTVTRPCRLASFAWPIPDSWGEIPSPRLMADVPVSVGGLDSAPVRIAAKSPVIEARVGEKVVVPLVHTRAYDFSGTINMKVVGTGFERAPAFNLPVNDNQSTATLDLKALNVQPGEYRVAFLGGGVVKYRHRPDMVSSAEAELQTKRTEVKSLEEVVKKAMVEAQNAPAPKKEQMTKALTESMAKMKAAATALTATEQQLKKAREAAQPRDVAEIIVCEPFTIRVLAAEKK